MVNQLREFLKPPIFDDEQLTAKARLLFGLLVALAVISVAQFLIVPFTTTIDTRALISMLFLVGSTIIGLVCVHRGWVHLSGGLVVVGLWLTVTLSVLDFGSILNPAFGAYVIVVLLAGLLFDLRTGVSVLIFSAGAGVIFVLLERQGVMGAKIDTLSPELIFFIEMVKLLLAPAFLYGYGYLISTALSSVQKSHDELQASQLSLENRSMALAEANEALRQSEARYRTLFDNAPEAIVVFDAVENRAVDVNHNAMALFGYSLDEFRHLPLEQLSGMEMPDWSAVSIAVQEVVKDGATPTFEWHLKDRAGTIFPCEMRLIRLPDSERELIRVSIIDVSERRNAEQVLQQAQKLESLGILAGGIAHDFNNLLVAMLGQTSLAVMKLGPVNPAKPHVERAVAAAQQAAKLTKQMLAFSGRGQFEVTTLNMNHLIQQNLPLFVAGIPKHITLVSELGGVAPIRADSSQIQQVVMNLGVNASQAIPAGHAGIIRMKTKMVTLSDDELARYGQFTGLLLPAGTYVCLMVEDNGVGMDAQTLSRIFDPFFSTKSEGSGLGLAAVLGIMRGHRGGLYVKSEPGRGTTFTLVFPPDTDPQPKLAEIDTQPSQLSTAGKVLIIDDEESVRKTLQSMLALHHIECILADDGWSGVQRYRAQLAEISLVLLDLSMPGLNGRETLVKLQEINPDVKVILSSGYSDWASRTLPGVVDFLPKPYDVNMLVKKISQHL